MKRWRIANNELANNRAAPVGPVMVLGSLDWTTPLTGDFRFECPTKELYEQVLTLLTARRASAFVDEEGGRIFARLAGGPPPCESFPSTITLTVEIDDEPGPAIVS